MLLHVTNTLYTHNWYPVADIQVVVPFSPKYWFTMLVFILYHVHCSYNMTNRFPVPKAHTHSTYSMLTKFYSNTY